MDIPRWKWRNRDLLLQEMDAQVRIKDIKALHELKAQLGPRWYEPGLHLLLLLAGVAFALTTLGLVDRVIDLYGRLLQQMGETPGDTSRLRFIFWFVAAGFMATLLLGIVLLELLWARVTAMRRMLEFQMRALEVHEARIAQRDDPAPEAAAPSPPET